MVSRPHSTGRRQGGSDPQEADRLFGADYRWSILAPGKHQFRVSAMGAVMGANVRVGMEDNLYLEKGRLARSNAEQVTRMREILELLSFEVATPEEARCSRARLAAGGFEMSPFAARQSGALEAAIGDLEARYSSASPKSLLQLARARRVLPGGNTRVALHYDPFPLFIERAEHGRVFDVGGHSYIDLMNDLTAGFYGHSNPVILAALCRALDNGISFGGSHRHEQALAEEICGRFSTIERVRFCNSGTEANLVAMGLARATTDRPLVLAFHGGYHGGLASYLDTRAPLNLDKPMMRFARFNDAEDVRRVLEAEGPQTAAIIVEPMMGSGGGILAERSFLSDLRGLADEWGRS